MIHSIKFYNPNLSKSKRKMHITKCRSEGKSVDIHSYEDDPEKDILKMLTSTLIKEKEYDNPFKIVYSEVEKEPEDNTETQETILNILTKRVPE